MIIIPARLASTRFPGKITADVLGLPMVIRCAKNVSSVDDVVVACDDESVKELCTSYGIKAVITSKEHNSGTDRINEAVKLLGLSDGEIIVNVQADEPFLEKEVVAAVKELVKNERNSFKMASCYKSIDKHMAENPNMVKVITDKDGYAIYFSRSIIPYDRDGGFYDYNGHLGIYGFDVISLREFCALGSSRLENIEKLEQLRAIEAGYKIKMAKVETKSFGIDTPEDLAEALAVFGEKSE
ncbi:MAG: 3-deoxy-manno-octulosonate cytidylyltransferase [Campylobacteraceae bacterium]|jgi:3-deoxy-manno-octulosonate cytidylyltransferase (CMP-KDO synthetase)|nr:3-deoxy-manno-octulosonate cytidylyltransferase [Campylobacteraceae bacterium]